MLGLSKELISRLNQRVGLSLQLPATALLDFGRALNELSEEGVYLLTDFGRRAKAGVRHRLFANPVPDGLVGVEIWAVARQRDETQVEIRRRKIRSDLWPVMRWTVTHAPGPRGPRSST